jgi:hypothetical protein
VACFCRQSERVLPESLVVFVILGGVKLRCGFIKQQEMSSWKMSRFRILLSLPLAPDTISAMTVATGVGDAHGLLISNSELQTKLHCLNLLSTV